MSRYGAEAQWSRGSASVADFLASRYPRAHVLRFDGGVELAASSSPGVVPLPWSDAAAVDPEEMFVASLASCHMLWFLSLAAEGGFCADRYVDAASGVLAKDSGGRLVMTVVTLRPQVAFAAEAAPSRSELDALHHAAHEACFIANSVKTEVRVEPVFA